MSESKANAGLQVPALGEYFGAMTVLAASRYQLGMLSDITQSPIGFRFSASRALRETYCRFEWNKQLPMKRGAKSAQIRADFA